MFKNPFKKIERRSIRKLIWYATLPLHVIYIILFGIFIIPYGVVVVLKDSYFDNFRMRRD